MVLMTVGGKGVIMQEMLIVILNECEGSVPVVRQAVNFFFYDLSYLGKRASSVQLC